MKNSCKFLKRDKAMVISDIILIIFHSGWIFYMANYSLWTAKKKAFENIDRKGGYTG